MSPVEVTWSDLRKYLRKNNIEYEHSGGDVVIKVGSQAHRIGHYFCTKHSQPLIPHHLKALERKFGITRRDILDA